MYAGPQSRQRGGVDAVSVVEDGAHVRTGGGVAVVEQALERVQIIGRLVHAVSLRTFLPRLVSDAPAESSGPRPARKGNLKRVG